MVIIMKKIGIMGGTFNPIHYGHLFLAEHAFDQLALDKILFMPSKNPPHKEKPQEVLEEQRVDMVKLAIRNNPHFELSTFELKRKGMTYTADTLTLLTKENPDTEYYFILGADSLFMLCEWKEPQVIFKHCTIVAASRDHALEEDIQKQVIFLQNEFQAKIQILKMPTIELSSRDIRKRIREGKSIRYYIPDTVLEYMEQHKLYLANQEDRF